VRASAPFGFAGQQYDAGPGTYAMRARTYSPGQGRFQSTDPQAYDPQVPVTINPYEYAGNMPTGMTDPSGQGWVWPGATNVFGDYQQQTAIGGPASGITAQYAGLGGPQGVGLLQQMLGADPAAQGYWVPVLRHSAAGSCLHASAQVVNSTTDNANVVDRKTHVYWDIEHAEAYNGSMVSRLNHIVNNARTNGVLWASSTCSHFIGDLSCAVPATAVDTQLHLGTTFPGPGPLPGNAQLVPIGPDLTGVLISLSDPLARGASLLAWRQTDGLILYTILLPAPQLICAPWDCVAGLANFLVFDDVRTAFGQNVPWYDRALAGVSLLGDAVPVLKLAKVGRVLEVGAKLARGVRAGRDAWATDRSIANVLRRAYAAWKGLCGACFPAGTTVARSTGATSIERLRVGDQVLAEDPASGKVEPDRVQAVIDDGVKPLIALDLSDGSTLRVTSNHAFWVDGGPGLAGAGWLEAGQLKPGDRLRTAAGKDVTVTGLHWNVGDAEVYTLTVAHDHTFFVGSARVLVHNGTASQMLACDLAASGIYPPSPLGYEAHHIVPTSVNGSWGLGVRSVLKSAQDILAKAGIGLNTADNGVWLPGKDLEPPYTEAYHGNVHTKDYYANIDKLLQQAVHNGRVNPTEVRHILQRISARLKANDTTLYK
jgi:RHS repeat-associated protein